MHSNFTFTCVLLLGKASLRAYVPKNERIHYLRLIGGDTSKYEKNKFEERRARAENENSENNENNIEKDGNKAEESKKNSDENQTSNEDKTEDMQAEIVAE